jgi:hypothetical protein
MHQTQPAVWAMSLSALSMAAGPAFAEIKTLSCRSAQGGAAYTYRIDYDTGRLEQIAPSGKPYSNRIVRATITPTAIIWSIDQPSSYVTGDKVTHQTTERWEGKIDRLAATGWVQSYYVDRYRDPGVQIACAVVGEPRL